MLTKSVLRSAYTTEATPAKAKRPKKRYVVFFLQLATKNIIHKTIIESTNDKLDDINPNTRRAIIYTTSIALIRLYKYMTEKTAKTTEIKTV